MMNGRWEGLRELQKKKAVFILQQLVNKLDSHHLGLYWCFCAFSFTLGVE